MPITASDLKFFGAANHAETDSATQGGAQSTAKKVELTQLAANDDIEAVSSNAADTMNLTVTARSTAGAIVSEIKALNGTTAVIFSVIGVVERVLKMVLASAAAGTITIRRSVGGATIATLEPGITEARILFYDSASEAAQAIRHEKFFAENTHATLSLTNAAIKLTLDPAARIRIGAAPSKDDTATVTNRKTAPASVTFVNDNVSQSVPTASLAASEAIGIWAELDLPANDPAQRNTMTLEVSGNTT